MSQPAPAKTKSFGPEAEFLQRLKGKRVAVKQHGIMEAATGKLVWVDRYSIGLRQSLFLGIDPETHGAVRRDEEVLLFKSGIAAVWQLSDESKTGDETNGRPTKAATE